jgi:hypothetical protein
MRSRCALQARHLSGRQDRGARGPLRCHPDGVEAGLLGEIHLGAGVVPDRGVIDRPDAQGRSRERRWGDRERGYDDHEQFHWVKRPLTTRSCRSPSHATGRVRHYHPSP